MNLIGIFDIQRALKFLLVFFLWCRFCRRHAISSGIGAFGAQDGDIFQQTATYLFSYLSLDSRCQNHSSLVFVLCTLEVHNVFLRIVHRYVLHVITRLSHCKQDIHTHTRVVEVLWSDWLSCGVTAKRKLTTVSGPFARCGRTRWSIVWMGWH